MSGLCSADRHSNGLIHLEDPHHAMTLGVAPRAGNMAFSMQVHGHEILRFPFESVDDFLARGGGWQGIPFLAPWANRLDEPAFYANGRRFAFDLELGNVRGPIPIHGLIANDPGWRVTDIGSEADAAWVTSRLDFFADPLLMKQFPFAHTIDMTYRLGGGTLEVETRLSNMAAQPMPVSIGFHPYFKLTDSERDDWTIAIGARAEWVLDARLLPTGETRPIEHVLPRPDATRLGDVDLDHVFGDLIRDADGCGVMKVRGRSQQI
jgi:aldose 1-epimerase